MKILLGLPLVADDSRIVFIYFLFTEDSKPPSSLKIWTGTNGIVLWLSDFISFSDKLQILFIIIKPNENIFDFSISKS